MPRKERITEPGFYHVINRGVERRYVFLEEEDFDCFLDTLKEQFEKYEIVLHAYCLMSNHYHLLIETKEKNISEAMRHLNSLYSMYFNKKYKRSGHLWQGRFASYFLYDDRHFWHVVKYIERNPIKANIVKRVEHYKYQSFFQRKYKMSYLQLIKDSDIFQMNLDEYEEFISSELDNKIVEKIYETPTYVKKDGKMKILYRKLESFFEYDRNEGVKKAYEYGYSKSEIAQYLDISHTSVGRIVQKGV